MKILSLPAFLVGLVLSGVFALVWNPFGSKPAQPKVVEPDEPSRLPSAIVRSDSESIALFRAQIERAPKSYFAFQRAIETVAGVPSSYLAEMLESDLEGTQKYSVIHLWALRDPQSALEHLRGWSRDDTYKSNAMGQVLESWAMKDAEAADAWLRDHLETENPKQNAFGIFGDLKEALVRGVAKSDPHLALALLREFKIHGAFSNITFETNEEWESVLSESNQADVLLDNWYVNDPAAFESWLTAQQPERRTDALRHQIACDLIRYADDPLVKVHEIWPTLAGRNRSSVASYFTTALVERDPNLAGEWLNQHEEDPDLDTARANFVRELSPLDPEAAYIWTTAIHKPQRRADAEKTVFQEWDRVDPQAAEKFFLAQGWDAERIAGLRRRN